MSDNENAPENQSEEQVYTVEQVNKIIKEAQERQLRVDHMRAYGNMFFAEALDHIGTLAKGDKVWKTVYEYGQLFRQQFESNTGQVQALPQNDTDKKQPSGQSSESKQ